VIYRLQLEVEGDVVLDAATCFRVGKFLFETETSQDGRWTRGSAGMRVDKSRFQTKVGLTAAPGTVSRIVIGADPVIHEMLIRTIQAFESHVSFMTEHALRRLRWDKPTAYWDPETEDEVPLVQLTKFQEEKYLNPRGARVKPDVLAGMGEKSQLLSELAVYKSFFREGSSELESFRHIQAFYDFYFVLEGFYAEGKSAEREVLKAFTANPELTALAEETLRAFTDHDETPSLRRFLVEERCRWDVEGLLQLLVRLRGRLHHFQPRSPRLQPTPFEQESFRSVALVVLLMATMAIGYREVALGERINPSAAERKTAPIA